MRMRLIFSPINSPSPPTYHALPHLSDLRFCLGALLALTVVVGFVLLLHFS